MKCNHHICKIEEEPNYPAGTTNWKEAFESVEYAYDKLYAQHEITEMKCEKFKRIMIDKHKDYIQAVREKVKLRNDIACWKNIAESLLFGFIAVSITFIFYILTHC